MRKYTEAKKEGNRKWDANNLDRISIALPKGQKEVIQAAAKANGESVNAYIQRAIAERMEREQAQAGGGFDISSAPGNIKL